MIHVLVPVDLDLGSSIAIRYAEMLSDLVEMSLQSVHVVVPDSKGPEPGSGWVRKTWEKALMNTDRDEIQSFLELEHAVSPRFSKPKVMLGDRQDELLHELKEGQYDLLMEGALPTFNPSDFYAMVASRLYRLMPCPAALVVKNLVRPQRAALILEDHVDQNLFASAFLRVLKEPVFELDVLFCRFDRSAKPVFHDRSETDLSVGAFAELLREKGWRFGSFQEVTGGPEDIAGQLQEYSLIASAMQRNSKGRGPAAELLGRVLSPVLLCWA